METAVKTITDAMPYVFGLVTSVLAEVLKNPILVIPFAVGFISLGISIFRKMRKLG